MTAHTALIDQAWQAINTATTTGSFCQAWLNLLCIELDPRLRGDDAKIRGDNALYRHSRESGNPAASAPSQTAVITQAVILLETDTQHAFAPVAAWPAEQLGQIEPALLSLAKQSLERHEGMQALDPAQSQLIRIAYPLQLPKRTMGVLALACQLPVGASEEANNFPDKQPANTAPLTALMRHIHARMAWLREPFYQQQLSQSQDDLQRLAGITEQLLVALGPEPLKQTLFSLCNQLARQLQCSRVAIGLRPSLSLKAGSSNALSTADQVYDDLELVALSDAAWFERQTRVVKRYLSAMQETAEWGTALNYDRAAAENSSPDPADSQEANPSSDLSAHQRLSDETGACSIHSEPLFHQGRLMGVLLLERDDSKGSAWREPERLWLHSLAASLPAILALKQQAQRNTWQTCRDDLRKLGQVLFGPRHLRWKLAASLGLITMLLLVLLPIDHRVHAKTVIEGEIQRVVAAPFEGFIASSHARAGDTIRAGELLAKLDDRELRLEQNRWESERRQHEQKLREAVAAGDLSNTQVISAQLRQAEAQLNLTNERIQRAQLLAPFDGTVVSGDLSQQIGAPVEQGKTLFEVAPLARYRVILQVDERDIRYVGLGQTGKLAITGLAGDALPFRVSKVTPVASAQDGRNHFRVEAQLNTAEAPQQLRPGMEGVGKISIGQRQLGWVLTHSFTDWLRLTLWNWLP